MPTSIILKEVGKPTSIILNGDVNLQPHLEESGDAHIHPPKGDMDAHLHHLKRAGDAHLHTSREGRSVYIHHLKLRLPDIKIFHSNRREIVANLSPKTRG